MADSFGGKNGIRPPVWEERTPISAFIRELRGWRLGTTIPAGKWAATVTFESMKGARKEMALQWLLDHETEAAADNGLDKLMKHMKEHVEGSTRDVRLTLVNDLLKFRRPDGMSIQAYLQKMESMRSRIRETGLDLIPTGASMKASEMIVVEHVAIQRPPRQDPPEGEEDEGAETANEEEFETRLRVRTAASAVMVKERLQFADKLESAWQEIMFGLDYHNSRLSANDQKMILGKIGEEEMTYQRISKELKILYPVQSEQVERSGTKHSSRRAYLSRGEPDYPTDFTEDANQSEVEGDIDSDQEEVQADASGDFTLTPQAFQAVSEEAAFLSKYKVSYDSKKNRFKVKPKGKAAPSKDAPTGVRKNPVDKVTGKILLCHGCGSDRHLNNACPKKKKDNAKPGKAPGKRQKARVAECEESVDESS